MKYANLKQIQSFLGKFKKITAIRRAGDMAIFIEFDGELGLFFDLSKADSAIYANPDFLNVKEYKAPFDVALKKRFWGAKILNLSVPEGNRILKLECEFQGSYKSLASSLFLEFTGRFTNAIITDEKGVIVEALRHIDNNFRVIKPGRELLELPPATIKERQTPPITDFARYFSEEFERVNNAKLENLRAVKSAAIERKMQNLSEILSGLENEADLNAQSEILSKNAGLILSNLHALRDYEREVTLNDFERGEVRLVLDDSPKIAANAMFAKAKRLKQKAAGLIIERQNLTEKLEFLSNLQTLVNEAKSAEELEILAPKKARAVKQKEQNQNVEDFYVEGYKISIGRNEKGNVWLLKNSKKDDIWMHLKDLPSAHVIIKTAKSAPSEEILRFAAKICVNFSVKGGGTYEVDFTKRNNVKITSGANVNYINFKTILVTKHD